MWKWFKRLLSGKPHFRIGGEDAYMLRWYLIPRNPWFNLYLHKFLRDDDDRALHDHPFNFISIMLKGSYIETTQGKTIQRSAPSIAYRPATHIHRVALLKRSDGTSIPCWTLVFTGKRVRLWGFHCPKGFVPWYTFVDSRDKGSIGRGCGEDNGEQPQTSGGTHVQE